MRAVRVGVVAAAVCFAGCSGRGRLDSKQAVQAGIEAHLKTRSDLVLSNMTMEIEDVTFSGGTAAALAKYQSKQLPDLAVGVRYGLRRAGDHWEVVSSFPLGMGSAPHARTNPPGRPQEQTTPPGAAPAPSRLATEPSH